jgi:type I restriction enzyme S subunit
MTCDWVTASVSDLQQQGVLLVEDGNHGEYRPRREEFVLDGVAYVRAADIRDGVVDFAAADTINKVARARIRKGIGAPGDVLLTHKGTVGRVARVPADAPVFVCSPQTTFWRVVDPERLDPGFLHAFMRSPGFTGQLRQRQHESDMAPYVSLTSQRGMTVAVPPISAQREIASVLRPLDDTIESALRLDRLLWHVLAMYFGHSFGSSVEGAEPLGNHVSVVRGRSYRSSELEPSTTALVTLKSVARGGGYQPDGLKPYSGDFKPQQIVSPGELVVAHTDLTQAAEVVGKPAIVLPDPRYERLVVSLDLAVVRPATERVTTSFLYFLFLHRAFQQHAYGYANGSTVLHLASDAISSFEFQPPDPASLAQFDSLAAPVFALQRQLAQEANQVRLVREAVLPRLVSGRLRVRDFEPVVAAA